MLVQDDDEEEDVKMAKSTATDPDEPVTISFGGDGSMRLGDIDGPEITAGGNSDSGAKDEL